MPKINAPHTELPAHKLHTTFRCYELQRPRQTPNAPDAPSHGAQRPQSESRGTRSSRASRRAGLHLARMSARDHVIVVWRLAPRAVIFGVGARADRLESTCWRCSTTTCAFALGRGVLRGLRQRPLAPCLWGGRSGRANWRQRQKPICRSDWRRTRCDGGAPPEPARSHILVSDRGTF